MNDKDEPNLHAIAEDWDAEPDDVVEIVLAKTFAFQPAFANMMWDGLTDQQKKFVRLLVMGGVGFGMNMVSLKVKEVADQWEKGDKST